MTRQPRLISWGTTNLCNLKCPHCYRDAGIKLENELTTEEAYDLLDQSKRLGCKLFVLSGGEPLLRGDIFDIAEYGANIGLEMILATSGILIDSKIASKIAKSGIKYVAISLDGANAKTHDSFRGVNGAFEKAIDAIRLCVNLGLKVQVNTTVTKLNFSEIKEIIDLSWKLGVKYIHIFHFVPVGRGYLGKLEVNPLIFSALLNELLHEQGKYPELMIKPTCAPFYWAYISVSKPAFLNEFLSLYPRGCTAGITYLYISPTGEVYPCPYLPIVAGNIRSQNLREIWSKSQVFKELRERKIIGKCSKCKFKDICGGCRARAYAYTGNYLESDPACILKVPVS